MWPVEQTAYPLFAKGGCRDHGTGTPRSGPAESSAPGPGAWSSAAGSGVSASEHRRQDRHGAQGTSELPRPCSRRLNRAGRAEEKRTFPGVRQPLRAPMTSARMSAAAMRNGQSRPNATTQGLSEMPASTAGVMQRTKQKNFSQPGTMFGESGAELPAVPQGVSSR